MYEVRQSDPALPCDAIVATFASCTEARHYASALNRAARARDGGRQRTPFWYVELMIGSQKRRAFEQQRSVGR